MSKIEPLRIRPGGADFTCWGSGLCCTDVHAWGPLDEKEAATLRLIDEDLVIPHGEGDLVILGNEDGCCVFQQEGGCALHAALGAKGKPKTCQQFPYMLIATPTGGRVATEHRCPCRTMGKREPITVERALEACDVEALDRVITATLPLDDDVEIEMDEWERIEAPFLEGVVTFEEAPLTGGDWNAIGATLEAERETNRFSQALRCFGAAILELPLPALNWSQTFDLAEERSSAGDPEAMLDDWVRDVIWSLDWAFQGSWRQARLDLVSRMELARRIAAGLPVGRADRRMAEAIAVVELAGLSDDYQAFIGAL